MPTYYQWLVAPMVTATGIIVSVLLATLVPILHASKRRRQVAEAAALVAQDAFGLVIDRLAIRFEPARLPVEGPTLREYRARAAVEALMSFDLADLPAPLVPNFSRIRSGLFALNTAMAQEGADDPKEKQTPDGTPHPNSERLARYSAVFGWTIGSYDAIRQSPLIRIDIAEYSWRPPAAAGIPSASGVETSQLPG